jgi:ABC-type Zn uptake system ZnuABC Zn-binding protein ZnuA
LEGGTVIIRTVPIETGGIWGRPEEAKRIAARVAAELSQRRPEQVPSFERGLAELQARIDAVHTRAREILQTHQGAPVTICQNGLKYLVEALGLSVASQLIDKAGSSGMATASSPKRIADVIEASRTRGAKAVVYAPQLALEQKCALISTELGVPGVKVPLLPGALEGADTYPDMVLLTANRIAAALAASAAGP